jgi:DNA polymerase-3 subunit delta'
MGQELHEQIWSDLVTRLDRLPHALLLHGPKGVGKLAFAERLAQLLLCEGKAPRASPCGTCPGCRWYLAGNHPDVRFVQPETLARIHPDAEETEAKKAKPSAEIRIDQVRELEDFLNLASHRGGRRIAIVHPAEDMNAHAANSLLKSLEEPPRGAMFVLVSHRPARLLPTVRSRCVPIALPLPDGDRARAWLEKQGVPDAGRWLAFAGGAPLAARDLAQGEHGARIGQLLAAIAEGDSATLEGASDREALERLAEVLQKYAIDCALAAAGVPRKYVRSGGPPATDARAWLAYARAMGRNRLLARHPLNARLFALEMLDAMPRS